METFYEQFEIYLEGAMDEQDRRDFERRLEADEAFRMEFESYRAIRSSLQENWKAQAQTEALQNTLQGLGREYFPAASEPGASAKSGLRWLWIAGAVAACALLALLFWPKDLYQQFYQTPIAALTVRSEGQQQLLQRAEAAFNSGDFARATTLFDSILIKRPDALVVRFFQGICQLELGDPAGARTFLTPLAEGPSVLASDAQWFVALSYLREGDRENCRSGLKKIPADSPRFAKASALLSKLSN